MSAYAGPVAAGGSAAGVARATGRRVLEVAAAGGHHVAMVCPPDAAKALLVPQLTSILPPLDDAAAWEVSALHALAGAPPGLPMTRRPPLEAPHPSISVSALVGSGLARPGVLSLAHRGVLLLDQAPRFGPPAWEALRQPLDQGRISLHRAGMESVLPARIQLVLSSNPCACATSDSGLTGGRVVGPLLDRVDIHVDLNPLTSTTLFDDTESVGVAGRVATARAAAAARWTADGWRSNAVVPTAALYERRWRLPAAVHAPIARLLDIGALSERRCDRLLRIAWTIADLGGHTSPNLDDAIEAVRLGARTIDWCTGPATTVIR